MARKKRVWYPGATYHVMNRGNRRTPIFSDHEDYLAFLKYVQKVQEKYPFKLHGICLMPNHYHMAIETISDDLGKIIQSISSIYAGYYNYRHNLSGHLFQGRYTACLINDERYFLEVSRYIHLNPVKANLVQSPEDYLYSSYRLFRKISDNNSNDVNKATLILDHVMKNMIYTERTLSAFDNNSDQYIAFVRDKLSHSEHEAMIQNDIKEDCFGLPA